MDLSRFCCLSIILTSLHFYETRDKVWAILIDVGHITILLKFAVVTFGFPWNTVSEQTSRKRDISILNWKDLVESTKIIDLILPTFLYFFCKLLTSHLVPEESWLFVHLLQLSITIDSVQILLTIWLGDP